MLEGSLDGTTWFVIEDKRRAGTDLPHDLVVREQGLQTRFVRLTLTELPYEASACVSGLRVFGKAEGAPPAAAAANVQAKRTDELSMHVSWIGDAVGYEVLWGHRPDKLYHSYRVFGKQAQEIRALVGACKKYYVRVDGFNESGITQGDVIEVN